MAWHRGPAGQSRGEPRERVAVPGRAEADSGSRATEDVPGRHLHEGTARCPQVLTNDATSVAACPARPWRTATETSPRWVRWTSTWSRERSWFWSAHLAAARARSCV